MPKHRTPLRYPGGKQKLTPFVREVLEANDLIGGDYAEPYTGGAGVAMELLLNGDVRKVHLNDTCRGIFGFWSSVVKQPEELCRRILKAPLTVAGWQKQREVFARREEFDLLDAGFSLFFLNRVNRSGIATGGLIGGMHQTGEWRMDARFNRLALIKRIELIATFASRIKVSNLDAETFLIRKVPALPSKSLVYCDPPYFHKADRLYPNYYKPGDHAKIAEIIQNAVTKPWMVSYDNAPEIKKCYASRRSFSYELQYNASKAYLGTELFIFDDDLKLPASSKLPGIQVGLASIW